MRQRLKWPWENCSEDLGGGVGLYRSLEQEASSPNIKRLLFIKENQMSQNLALFYVWEDVRDWAYWNHSFHMHLTHLEPASWGLIIHTLGPCSPWGVTDGCQWPALFFLGALEVQRLTFGGPESQILHGCDILDYWYGRKYPASQTALLSQLFSPFNFSYLLPC